MERIAANRRFEELVARIFQAADFEVRQSHAFPDRGPDLVLKHNGVTSVVEVKIYRSRTPNPGDIRRAIDTLAHMRALTSATNAVLVINLQSERIRAVIPDLADIILIGIDDLTILANGNEKLLAEIADVVRELNSALADFDRPLDPPPLSDRDVLAMLTRSAPMRPRPHPSPKPARGTMLAADLRAINPGGSTIKQTLPSGETAVPWRLFERIGRSALEYVFEGVLGDWAEQRWVGGEANRLDLMAKIRGDDVFCRTLIEDFRSRHVLFELKNYGGRIKTNNIHVTEKYLFPTALRSTAIILSPKGLDDHAFLATQGALRDANKLLLDLKVETLCTMLEEKDAGTPPSLRMEALLDDFLLSLGR